MSNFLLPLVNDDERCFDCIVIGSGLAGLQCARSLIDDHGVDSSEILILEAQDYVGGRVKQECDFVKGTKIELGAEIIHGDNTKLTQFAKKANEPISAAFCWAQGDGGPYDYSVDGGYGLYYVGSGDNKKLLRYDDKDPEFVRLNKTLRELGLIDDHTIGEDNSVLGFLKSQGFDKDMLRLASAGFSNTFCSTSEGMSLKQVARSQRLWHGNDEDEGEFRFKNSYSCVVDSLKKGVNIKLNTPVVEIDYSNGYRNESPASTGDSSPVSSVADSEAERIKVITSDGTVYFTRSVVVTSSPKVLLSDLILFNPPLSVAKIQGLESIDMHRAMKVIFKFKKRFFPKNVQGIVMGVDSCLVPEIWFKNITNSQTEKLLAAGEIVDDEGEVACTATCFACANYADKLISMPQKEMYKAILDQLDDMFSHLQPSHMSAELSSDDETPDSLPKPSDVFIDAMIVDWASNKYIGGGYSCGRKGWNLQKAQAVQEPISIGRNGCIFFAGEATNVSQPGGTAHAALETGERAADEVSAFLDLYFN